MDIIHVEVVFEDQFSGAKEKKVVTTRSRDTFEKMKAGVGTCFSRLENHVRMDLKVISVKQVTDPDTAGKK